MADSENTAANSSNWALSLQVDLLGLGGVFTQPAVDVVYACSKSSIQPFALLALADLGALILPDSDMVQKAKASFESPRRIIVDRLKLSLGLAVDPVSKKIQENNHFAAAFLLAVGCRPVYTVIETAKLLQQLMQKRRRSALQLPSINQLVDVLSHINGYGDLIETTSADQIWVELSRRVSSGGFPLEIDRPHSPHDAHVLAEIIQKTFEALQDDENQQVIIRGCYCGLFIAMIFLWLCPSSTACVVNANQVYPLHNIKARLVVDIATLADPWKWEIVKSRTEISLPELLSQFAYYPLKGAKDTIERALDDKKTRAIGLLATSFVEVAFEDGQLVSTSSDRELATTEKVRKTLSEMCPDNAFAKTYTSVMTRFGWEENVVITRDRARITEILRKAISTASFDTNTVRYDQVTGSWLDHRTGKPLLTSLLFQFRHELQDIDDTFMLLSNLEDFGEVVEYSNHLAVQSLCLFLFNPQVADYLKYTPLTSSQASQQALQVMVRLLVRSDQLPTASGDTPLEQLLEMYFSQEMGFLEFRHLAMTFMLPGDGFKVSQNSLAASGNGYVVYSAILETLAGSKIKSARAVHETTNKMIGEIRSLEVSRTEIDDEREAAWAIWVIPGQIQWDDRPQTIRDIVDVGSRMPGGQRLSEPHSPINPFSREGTFIGYDLRPARDLAGFVIGHVVGISQEMGLRGPGVDFQQVSMIPYITMANSIIPPSETFAELDKLPSNPNLHLSWIESIQAWAFAEYVEDSYVSKRMEEDNSQRWKLKGYFRSNWLQWCPMNRDCTDTRIIVSTTDSEVGSRFFEAGHSMFGRHHIRKVFIRYGQASLVDCLLTCLNQDEVAKKYSAIVF